MTVAYSSDKVFCVGVVAWPKVSNSVLGYFKNTAWHRSRSTGIYKLASSSNTLLLTSIFLRIKSMQQLINSTVSNWLIDCKNFTIGLI